MEYRELDRENKAMYRIVVDDIRDNKIFNIAVSKTWCPDPSSFSSCRHYTWWFRDRGSFFSMYIAVEYVDASRNYFEVEGEKPGDLWFQRFSELGEKISSDGVKSAARDIISTLSKVVFNQLMRLMSDPFYTYQQSFFYSKENFTVMTIVSSRKDGGEIVYGIEAQNSVAIYVYYHHPERKGFPYIKAVIKPEKIDLSALKTCTPSEAVDLIIQTLINELKSYTT
jgi:hypothetical protein